LGSTAIEMTGSGTSGFEHDFEILVAQRIARSNVPQTNQCRDVARISGLDVDPFIGLNHHDAADAFAFARARL